MPKIETHRPEDRFVAAFEMNEGHTLNGTNARLQGLRKEAFARFSALGFPTTKQEAWKYTRITDVLQHDYAVRIKPELPKLAADDVAPFRIPGLDAHLVVTVNGRYAEGLSDVGALPEGVLVTSLAAASERHAELLNRYLGRYAGYDDAFTALNTAFTQDGVFVYVPPNTAVEKPVHIVNLIDTGEDLFMQPRNLFVFERGSQARLVETGEARTNTKTFTNSVDEIYVGRNAHASYYKVQREGDRASQVSNTHVYQDGDSVFSVHTITLGGAVVRNNLTIRPDAENCETHLYGLFLPTGTQHVDSHTLVDHVKPHCNSHELYKGVLADRSSGVFNGKVFVHRDAQKIDAFQENKTIVLSTDARMYSKPELEIYADDVKCSHGATTGQLDAEALFYLRSRGLSEARARGILLVAFARDIVETVGIEPVRAWLDELITSRFD